MTPDDQAVAVTIKYPTASEVDAKLRAALNALDRVRALHADFGDGYCGLCPADAWPCATIRALDGTE